MIESSFIFTIHFREKPLQLIWQELVPNDSLPNLIFFILTEEVIRRTNETSQFVPVPHDLTFLDILA